MVSVVGDYVAWIVAGAALLCVMLEVTVAEVSAARDGIDWHREFGTPACACRPCRRGYVRAAATALARSACAFNTPAAARSIARCAGPEGEHATWNWPR